MNIAYINRSYEVDMKNEIQIENYVIIKNLNCLEPIFIILPLTPGNNFLYLQFKNYYKSPAALIMPMIPTKIQNIFSKEYALSFFRTEHHDNMTASVVLNAQTNKKGL